MAGTTKLVRLVIKGEKPLLMHNERLANPLDEWTIAIKKISGKREKTEEDHREIARLEFLGGLYYDEDYGVHIPARNLKKCFEEGAAIIKKGTQVKRGVIINEEAFPLIYKGPKKPDELYKAGFSYTCMVGNRTTGSRVPRTRPRFNPSWSVEMIFQFMPSQINEADLRTCIENAGELVGLGDRRIMKGGNFGKFAIHSWNE